MTLLLPGALEVEYEELKTVPLPAATASHVPLAHHHLVDMMRYALPYYGHEIVEETFGVSEDGMRFFGLMMLKSTYGDYTDLVGLRNSNDRKFPIGIAIGAKVMVCSNLSFHGEHVIKRKHTSRSKLELPGLIAHVIEPLRAQREAQQNAFNRYKQTELSDRAADHFILQLYRNGVLNIQRVPDVLQQWNEPTHDWGPKSVWRLFNAATFALTGKVAEKPSLTSDLHKTLDLACVEV